MFEFLKKRRAPEVKDSSVGRVIAWTRSPAGGQPICLISVEFEKVSIERADTHEELAHWGSG